VPPPAALATPSDETNEWIAAQQALTSAVFATCPGKERLKQRCLDAYNYEKWYTPAKRGESLFVWSHNTGLQNQNVMWCGPVPCDNGAGRVLLDPNALSTDGTAALSTHRFSKDGAKLAYGISRSGSDWVTIYVRDVASGADSAGDVDVVQWVKFSGIEWAHDGSGFFYSRYPAPAGVGTTEDGGAAGTETAAAEFHALYFHALGTPQTADLLIAENKSEKNWMFGAEITDDGRYLLVSVSESCDPVNRLFVAEIAAAAEGGGGGVAALPRMEQAPDGSNGVALRKVVDDFDCGWDYIANDGETFFFKTNQGAPNRKVVKGPIFGGPAAWADHVAEAPSVMRWAGVANGDALCICYMRDVKDEIAVHSLASGAHGHDLPMPGPGCIVGFSAERDQPDVFFKFTGFTTPGTIFKWERAGPDAAAEAYAGPPAIFRETTVNGLDLDSFASSQVFFTSKDGTRVPMSVVHAKGMALDGSAPALLYGYGGFNISIPPSFNPFKLVLVAEMGGTYAVANIRGGGEYGEAWHDGGTKGSKQNVFDDFIGAAEHLISAGYTSAPRLACQGGSNGGLLVGAVCNQRPDLFQCGMAQVGAMDMLRFRSPLALTSA